MRINCPQNLIRKRTCERALSTTAVVSRNAKYIHHLENCRTVFTPHYHLQPFTPAPRNFATNKVSFSSCLSVKPKNDETNCSDSEIALTSSDGVVATPIDFDVASKIDGSESQIVTINLKPGQVLRAESGSMLYMTAGVEMEATSGGGVSAGFKRMLTGQNIFLTDFRYTGESGTSGEVALGPGFPSKIVHLKLEDHGGKIIAQKGALVCSSHTVDIEMEFAKKFTAGFFGGEGFVLQALTGTGDVFVKAGGTLVKRVLKNDETLRVSSGSLVAFEKEVDFDVQMMPGFKNAMFGGEGLFVTTLKGPGTIWLQGQPADRMISEISRRVPGGGIGLGIPIPLGMGGAGGGDSESAGEPDGEIEGMGEVAATDEAIMADRNAAVASSGFGGDDISSSQLDDPESPSGLFGDAAPTDFTPPSNQASEDDFFTEEGLNSTDDVDQSFSTETDDWASSDNMDDFEDNETTFTSDDSDSGISDNSESDGGLMNTLWDFFRDMNDD